MAYTSSYQTFLGGVVKQKRGSEDKEGSLEKVRVAQVKRLTSYHIFSLIFTSLIISIFLISLQSHLE